MAEKRLFHVESKLFELVKNAIEVSIIERGRKHRSTVSMGFAAAFWFRDSLLEIAKLSNTRNVFRSFREGNKVFVVQKQQNGRGSFVTITVLGDSKGRGGVIIPTGKESWGWRGLSEELDGLLNPKAATNHGEIHRRPLASKAPAQGNFRNDFCSFKAAVTQGKNLPKILPINSGVDNSSGELHAENEVILNLKVKLLCGTDGKWHAAWAGLIDNDASGPEQGPTYVPKPGPKQDQNLGHIHMLKPTPVQAPRNQVWRPVGLKPNTMGCLANKNGKTGSGVGETRLPETTVSNRFSIFQVGKSSGTCETADLTSSPVAETESIENSIPSAGTTESTSTLSIAPAVTISHPPAGEDIARTWGSSSNWMLELRDGRRITIPFFLIRSMPSQEGEGE